MTDSEVQREIEVQKTLYISGMVSIDDFAERLFELGVKFANECIQEQIIDEVSEGRDDP